MSGTDEVVGVEEGNVAAVFQAQGLGRSEEDLPILLRLVVLQTHDQDAAKKDDRYQ